MRPVGHVHRRHGWSGRRNAAAGRRLSGWRCMVESACWALTAAANGQGGWGVDLPGVRPWGTQP